MMPFTVERRSALAARPPVRTHHGANAPYGFAKRTHAPGSDLATTIRAVRDHAVLGPSPCSCALCSLSASPQRVLAAVVLADLARLDRAPPVFAGAVPRHRLRQAVRELDPRRPAERSGLGRVPRIAAVGAEGVVDVPDAGAPLAAGQPQQLGGDLAVGAAVAAAEVVDLAAGAVLEHVRDPPGVV